MKTARLDAARQSTTPNDGRPAYRVLRYNGSAQHMVWIAGWWFCFRNRVAARNVRTAALRRKETSG